MRKCRSLVLQFIQYPAPRKGLDGAESGIFVIALFTPQSLPAPLSMSAASARAAPRLDTPDHPSEPVRMAARRTPSRDLRIRRLPTVSDPAHQEEGRIQAVSALDVMIEEGLRNGTLKDFDPETILRPLSGRSKP